MNPTHFIEQYRQKDRTLTVNGPVLEIDRLQESLLLTQHSNCLTIAVFKIRYKYADDILDSVGGGYKQIT